MKVPPFSFNDSLRSRTVTSPTDMQSVRQCSQNSNHSSTFSLFSRDSHLATVHKLGFPSSSFSFELFSPSSTRCRSSENSHFTSFYSIESFSSSSRSCRLFFFYYSRISLCGRRLSSIDSISIFFRRSISSLSFATSRFFCEFLFASWRSSRLSICLVFSERLSEVFSSHLFRFVLLSLYFHSFCFFNVVLISFGHALVDFSSMTLSLLYRYCFHCLQTTYLNHLSFDFVSSFSSRNCLNSIYSFSSFLPFRDHLHLFQTIDYDCLFFIDFLSHLNSFLLSVTI